MLAPLKIMDIGVLLSDRRTCWLYDDARVATHRSRRQRGSGPPGGATRRAGGSGAVSGSAGRLVERVLVVGEVVLRDGGEAGADRGLGRLALDRGDGLLHAELADLRRLLGDQRLDDAVLEVLHLLRAGVEADDLDRVELARLAQAARARKSTRLN